MSTSHFLLSFIKPNLKIYFQFILTGRIKNSQEKWVENIEKKILVKKLKVDCVINAQLKHQKQNLFEWPDFIGPWSKLWWGLTCLIKEDRSLQKDVKTMFFFCFFLHIFLFRMKFFSTEKPKRYSVILYTIFRN